MAPSTNLRRSGRDRKPSLKQAANDDAMDLDQTITVGASKPNVIVSKTARMSVLPSPKRRTSKLRPVGVSAPKIKKRRGQQKGGRSPAITHPRSRPSTLKKQKKESPEPVRPFRFMDLPLEIREHIYKLAILPREYHLNGDRIDMLRVYPLGNYAEWLALRSARSTVPLQVQLLRVSKKIHDEASQVLYHQGRFIFRHNYDLSWFLGSLGQRYSSMIGDITVIEFNSIDGGWGFERLSKCRELKKLTLHMTAPGFLEGVSGVDRSLDVESAPGMKELLLIRGLNNFTITRGCDLPPHLISLEAKVFKLLRENLVKPRKVF